MSIWEAYQRRMGVQGLTKRESTLKREFHFLNTKLKDNLSYFDVLIDDKPQGVAIINSDNLNEKKMYSLHGDDIKCGSMVKWQDNYWLVVEKDANNEVYTRTKLLQCNHLLKWVDDDNVIHEQWCVIEDGTKYLVGELEDRNFVVTRGDSRVAMTIAKNEHTIKLNRKNRFLINDPDSGSNDKVAYLLTKPLKVGKTYQGEGIYSFVLQEVVSTEDDNIELGIADYYKHFPKNTTEEKVDKTDERKVWL